MLDLGFIRVHPEVVKAASAEKGDPADVDGILRLDERRRAFLTEVETLRQQRNQASQRVPQLKQAGQDASALIAETRALGERIKALEADLEQIEPDLRAALLRVPNIPQADVPHGKDANDNVVVRTWGEPRRFDFEPKAHWDLGAALGLFDFDRATKVSGPHFACFTGPGARLVRGLINFMLDLHTTEHGYTEIFPPFLVNRASMTGTGQLPKLEDDMYHLERDDLFLTPTAEVPVTNLHRDEILSHADLPIAYTAYTACFRREAGSYGRETRGLIRVHQFDKVELLKFVHPDTGRDELERITAHAEAVLQRLGLVYRVALLCRGELSFAGSKCYDIELWAPGAGRWLEVSSCSLFTDFQARRANIRFRDVDGTVRFVHTLNGSGTALPRLVVALLENGQRADGSVVLPEALAPYLRGQTVLAP
jgi:seryl-tRNA synthetase